MLAHLVVVTASWLQILQPPVVTGPRAAETPIRLERASATVPVEASVLGALPPLRRAPALDVGRAWVAAKGVPDTAEQARHVEERRLLALVADDLLPITTLSDAFGRTLRLRDRWRNRGWASPELVAVIGRAAELLAERMPGVMVTVGDISQEGGGQIPYGARVQILRDGPLRTPASDLLARTHVRFGRVERVETVDPQEAFPIEASRFASFEDPVLVDTRVTAASDCEGCPLEARVETRRFWLADPKEGKRVGRWLVELNRQLRGATVVSRSREGQGAERLHRAVFIQGDRQVEVIARRRPAPGLRLADLVEVRRATLDPKKPGVAISESRFLPEQTADGTRVVVWRALYEATHVSHLSGRDADISYVTTSIPYQFTKEIGEIDVEGSRAWIEILAEAASDVGATVDGMLIDPRVRSRLSKGMPKARKEHPAWGMIRSSRGHDSHIHLRLRPGFAAVARAAQD